MMWSSSAGSMGSGVIDVELAEASEDVEWFIPEKVSQEWWYDSSPVLLLSLW